MAVDMAIVGDTMTALAVATSKYIIYVIYLYIKKRNDETGKYCKANKEIQLHSDNNDQ